MSTHADNLNLGTIEVGIIRMVSTYTDEGYVMRPQVGRRAIQVFKSAKRSADVFKKSIRLTPEQLAADLDFVMLARQAIRQGKKYSEALCNWEDRPTVTKAVDIIRDMQQKHDEAVQQQHRDAQDASIYAKRQAEQPTRQAVEESYHLAGYRQCTQGHTLKIVIGDAPGVDYDIVRGDRYSSRCRYNRLESYHEITVTPDWIKTVPVAGLELWAGRLVIGMRYIGMDDDCQTMFDLTTVKQGAGTSLTTETITVFGTPGLFVKVGKRRPYVHKTLPGEIAADYMEEHGKPKQWADVLRVGTLSLIEV